MQKSEKVIYLVIYLVRPYQEKTPYLAWDHADANPRIGPFCNFSNHVDAVWMYSHSQPLWWIGPGYSSYWSLFLRRSV